MGSSAGPSSQSKSNLTDICFAFVQDRDPFVEDPNRECHIGTVQVYLQSLAFMIELKDQLSINDYGGNEVGIINVEVVPCDEVGNEYDERDDVYVDSPQELLGRSIHFVQRDGHSLLSSLLVCLRTEARQALSRSEQTFRALR